MSCLKSQKPTGGVLRSVGSFGLLVIRPSLLRCFLELIHSWSRKHGTPGRVILFYIGSVFEIVVLCDVSLAAIHSRV